MEMNKCKIVQDLLPLYADDLCSPETKEFIEEHLRECEECKIYFEEMTEGIVSTSTFENIRTELKETDEFIQSLSEKWHLKFRLSIGRIIAIILILLLLTQKELVKIPGSDLQVSELQITEESVKAEEPSRIKVSFIMNDRKDGYSFTNVNVSFDEESNLYLTPVRPVLSRTKKDRRATGWNNHITWFIEPDSDTKKIYVGTKKNCKLVWGKNEKEKN